jgi:hypothetical protein
MLLAASNADGSAVELLIVPSGSKPGDRVFVEGHEQGLFLLSFSSSYLLFKNN